MKELNINKTELRMIQQRLREAIKQSGMQQKEIAAKLGISPQTVSKYMKKDIFPALDTLANLCILLDISSDEILGITDSIK